MINYKKQTAVIGEDPTSEVPGLKTRNVRSIQL